MSNHLAVIGAGVIGICTALKAIEAGFKVTLIDPNPPGSGCSAGNAGHFATEQVFPLADPTLLPKIPNMLLNPSGPLSIAPRYFLSVLPWLLRFIAQMPKSKRHHNARVLRNLCEAALPAWQSLLSRYQLNQHLTLNGSLLVFESTPMGHIKKIAQQYRDQGVQVQILEDSVLHRLEPSLSNKINAALYFESVGHTADPLALSRALFHQFENLGGTYLPRKVLSLANCTQEWRLTLDNNEAYPCFDKVVICSGIHSAKLCEQLGYVIPLEAERGYHLNTQPSEMPLRPIASFERKFIMTPMDMGLRLAGTVEFAGIEAAPNPKRADGFYQHGCALWPSLRQASDPRCAENRWMGHRPSLPDSLPIISRALQPNLYFNFGHQHLGLTLAAVSAEQLINLIEAKAFIDEASLSITRFC